MQQLLQQQQQQQQFSVSGVYHEGISLRNYWTL
jgi:hypothetical protein